MAPNVAASPFRVQIGDEVWGDLRARIAATRWPDEVPGIGWAQGTELAYLRDFLDYWAHGFDWDSAQPQLNRYPQLITDDGVHFVHVKRGGPAILLTHGWPSAFIEYLPVADLLPEFDLVIPSLPGYGFSARPPKTGVNYRYVSERWHRLMGELGYERYGAGGGDFGAGVATFLAIDHPDAVTGIHLTNLELSTDRGAPLSEVERAYLDANEAWASAERGYSAIQSTKPQTVGYGLNDSPAGLAGYLLEKWNSWTDTTPSRDFLCTLLTIYWATQSITTSMRDYWDNRRHRVDPTYVDTPTGFAVFAHETVPEGEPPREFAERLYNIQRWTVFGHGGHFAPIEHPDLVASELRAFFSDRS